MTACNLRSLLLAAIVLSNCVTWTASRHHYTHTASGHRSRHRRQGAGLYLSASYVIPGGEGAGWGEWGTVSACSRTCGGGVASQKRICLRMGSDGQPQCTGGDTKYFSCETQDCPPDSPDFRASQCAEFNDKEFRGVKYEWIPYTKGARACELNCMPRGERFYYRYKQKVVDGTRCDDDSVNVCVDGQCQPVGCDMMLGSNAREDKCRECRGNGSNCNTNTGILNSQDYTMGYNDILLIPQGSTSIVIEEIAPSDNYLSLRAKNNGTYYLNGHYRIDFPRTMEIAGSLWTYERSQQGFPAPDKLRSQGPTTEPLYLLLLLQGRNVGVRYEYSVPKNTSPPLDKKYHWVHDEFTPCSVSCGGGIQSRNVTCRSREELEVVDDALCDEGLKLASNQSCNTDPCPAQWVESPWGECSKNCGEGGIRSRQVECQKVISNGVASIVSEKECIETLGPKPKIFEECNHDTACPTWFIGAWKPCDRLCDEGNQTRQVVCHQKIDGRVKVLDDKDCEDEKPESDKTCMLKPCAGVDWVTAKWTKCDSCLTKVQTRTAFCISLNQADPSKIAIINDTFCSYHTKPETEKPCPEVKTCEYMWYATQWSNCSVKCGEGNQTRKVFCGLFDEGTVKKVEDDKCAGLEKYIDTKPCSVSKEKCPVQWFKGPWEKCSEEKGNQDRLVACLDGLTTADCPTEHIFATTQGCDSTDAETNTTLVSDTVEDSDDDYCDEDDSDYEEEALDEFIPTTVLGDDPTFSTINEDTTSMEDLEGSGSSETSDFIWTSSISGLSSVTTKAPDTERTREIDSSPFDNSTEIDFDSTGSTEATKSEASGATEAVTLNTNETSTLAASTSGANTTDSDDTTVSQSTSSEETSITYGSTSSSDESKITSNITETSTVGDFSNATIPSDTTEPGTLGTTSKDAENSTAVDEVTTLNSTETSTVADLSNFTKPSDTTETGTTEPISKYDETSTILDELTTLNSTETSTVADLSNFTKPSDTTETGTTEPTSKDAENSTTVSEVITSNSTETSIDADFSNATLSSDTTETGTTEPTSTDAEDFTVTNTASSNDMSNPTTGSDIVSGSETTVATTLNETETESSTITGSTSSSNETTESTQTEASDVINTSEGKTSSNSEVSAVSTVTIEEDSTTPSVSETILNSTESPTLSSSVATESNTTESLWSTESTEPPSSNASTSASEIKTTETTEESTISSNTEGSTISTELAGSGKTTVDDLETTTSTATDVETTNTTGTESLTDSDVTGLSTTESGTGETKISVSTESTSSGVIDVSSTVESTGSTISVSESTTLASTGSTQTEGTSVSTESSATENETTSSGISSGTANTTEEIEGFTTEGIFIVSSQSTSGWFTSITTKGKTCKRRKPNCLKTPFGCCPDMKTPAGGPFDFNCTKPKTCKETDFGCCPDGVSPAHGHDNKGCPVEPCEDTLFGCCLSDNKTAAEGNDQDGCPPPCVASDYGCCDDNETEAIGPRHKGCSEAETITTVAETETTETGTESSTELSTESSTELSTESATDQTNFSSLSSLGYSDTDSTTTYSTEETVTGSEVTNATDTTETSSTSPIPCVDSEFGCCYDNETAAAAPGGQGCPCNATEFGCCSDGVSPAQGINLRGCVESCNTSAHGCCSDGTTPAHGPDGEGCCISTAFGCCPDNRRPSQGPHLEGCACVNYTFGCCPDNKTIARGPNNEGCGCQYTSHGCCPDRHTAASGLNNEGCSCVTYQFGCCNDGVTIAKGPNKQGCECQYSKFGCCGDEKTPATDTNGGGCDCSTSKYGCCPDGTTNAQGLKFLGCTDVPEDKQASCGLKADRGSCTNYTVMYFYDVEYGGCSRFWYGGCEGNGNKFTTQEECNDVCVNPSPKDACKLPSIKGSCTDENTRWAYSSSQEQCVPFTYGGCLGNANKFDSRELCQAQCDPERSDDQCSLPLDQGPCAGNFSHWGYNKESQRCEQFTWGGCQGNANRFSTEVACQMSCDRPGTLKPQCSEPQEQKGDCKNKLALWSFSQSEDRCEPFYHTGCGGNSNKFDSRETCEQTCPSAYVPDKCTLPALPGECADYRLKWFYDTSIKRCRQFYYGGCGGNNNNFDTEAQCENSCSEEILYPTTTTTTTVRSPVAPQELTEMCLSGIDPGPCNNFGTRSAYDSSQGRCVNFEYGGCGGNRNNFPNEQYCNYYCHSIQDVCQLPMMTGPCSDSVMQWFYDPSSDSCSQFTYGGCEGNANRFDSQEACESRCRRSGVATTTTTTTPAPAPSIDNRFQEPIPECKVSPSLEECTSPSVVWYMDAARSECVEHINQERGYNCRYTATFSTQEACERKCGVFRDVDVCKQRIDPGPCRNFVLKVFFDQETNSCKEFQYGGCQGGPNRFATMEECSEVCKPQVDEDLCLLPADGGNCAENNKAWYYDRESDACGQFAYTGCGGNANRFATEEDCEARCRQPVVPPPPEPADECITPPSLTPCGDNIPVFYFNSEEQQCKYAEIGSCNYANSYSTEEECQRRCGDFKGQDVCGAPLDPGPCRAAILKYYWDVATGTCETFMYGGCQGGPNRFETPEECENVCGAYRPAAACAEPVAVGAACGGAGPRWYYSAAHRDCRAFAFLGCGGNDNNFLSYERCVDECLPLRRRPDTPAPPKPIPQKEPKVTVAVGGTATLRCLFHGNPPPRITWKHGEITIDGSVGRYRLTSDGALEIVSVFRNDTGVYICVAENNLGTSTQEIYLEVGDSNEVADCTAYEQECANIQCNGRIEQVATSDGCRQCVCTTPCDALRRECDAVRCPNIRRTQEGICERCECVTSSPCSEVTCPAGERCVIVAYRNPLGNGGLQNGTECRQINKAGLCPIDNAIGGGECALECSDDADCRGDGKCCMRDCSHVCVSPELAGTTTHRPDAPAPPEPQPLPEPQVSATEGGLATLRCLFHGNPPPRITWRRGELTIDGNVGRYRLTSDGALEIVSVFRNDTGVYICVADNELGTSKQEVQLIVNDPVDSDVGIAGDVNAVVVGELDQPLEVKCLAYGFPEPSVYWYRSDASLVPFNNLRFQARLNTLLIRRLDVDTLGTYTCQAYNGNGKAASWSVQVQAYQPEGIVLDHEYIVSRHPRPPARPSLPPTTLFTTTTTTTTEVPQQVFKVPVSAHITTPINTVNLGAEMRLVCEVDGFPAPQAFWTKDGERVVPNERILVAENEVSSRLSVSRVELADSGVYTCHVANAYSRAEDSADMRVQQMVVPAKCTDNPYFAKCDLIVRNNFCRHEYYRKFCCKSCVEAGQLDPREAELQADQPYRRK